MTQNILAHHNLPVYPESHRCENCVYWNARHVVSDDRQGYPERYAQCACEDDEAPFADAERGLPIVFMPSDGFCPAFEIHPEAHAEIRDEADLYRALDTYINRQAF